MNDGHGTGLRVRSMVRFGLSVISGAALMVAAVWLCVLAAGTPWSLLIVAALFGAVWCGDCFTTRRPSRLSPLQRFERREAERRRAA